MGLFLLWKKRDNLCKFLALLHLVLFAKVLFYSHFFVQQIIGRRRDITRPIALLISRCVCMSTLNVPPQNPIAVDVCTTYSRHYALLRVQYLLLGPDFLILYLGWSKKNVSSNNLFRPMPARELFSPRVTSRHTSLPLLLDRRLFQTTTELKKKIPPSKAMPLYTPILKKKQLTTERPFFPSSHLFFRCTHTLLSSRPPTAHVMAVLW